MGPTAPPQDRANDGFAPGLAMAQGELLRLAQELQLRGEPFAMVTVVRAVAPTSAIAGAQAIVRSDGSLHGWIGGGCTKQVVVTAALEAIRRDAPRLLHVGNDAQALEDDVECHRMPCASNGQVELFVQPYTQAPLLLLLGATPVAACASAFAQQVGFRVTTDCEGAQPQLALVATQGEGDEPALQRALSSTARRVLLIASARKAQRLRESLRRQGVSEERLAQLEAPAGPDIGAHTPAQIALAAVAGALAWWHSREGQAPATSAEAPIAVAPPVALAQAQRVADPVCGMLIDVAQGRHTFDYEGKRWFFCCEGCRAAFEREPQRYAESRQPAREWTASGLPT